MSENSARVCISRTPDLTRRRAWKPCLNSVIRALGMLVVHQTCTHARHRLASVMSVDNMHPAMSDTTIYLFISRVNASGRSVRYGTLIRCIAKKATYLHSCVTHSH